MARLFNDAANDFLANANAIITAPPFAMICWFNTDTLAINQTLMGIFDNGGNSNYFRLWIDAAANHVNADSTSSAAGNTQATTTNSYSANTWHLAAGVYADTNDKRALLDGTGKGTDATNVTPAGLDAINIGRLGSLNPIQYTSGMIAEVAFWDLTNWPGATNADKANNFEAILPSIAGGASPLCFPLGLKAYYNLIRDINDKVGNYNLTATGTTVANHPRVIRPNSNQPFFVTSGAAPPATGIMTCNTGYWGSI